MDALTRTDRPIKHVVGFSGGIDSQACARWVLNRNNPADVILLNSNAGGNEHPLTTQFLQWYSERVHPITFIEPEIRDLGGTGTKPGKIKERRDEFSEAATLTFDRLAYIKGIFPSRTAQFCTTFLKLAPQKRWQDENLPGVTVIRYSGVRRQESQDRRKANAIGYDDYFDCELRQPLVDWTKQMCFDYVKAHGESVNELYTLGFSRIGCAPCVNSNKQDIRAWADRAPEMIDKVREWERRNGTTFFSPMVPGLKINWIDEVVAWSKTKHGGKQLDILVLEPRPACESKYGLCE